MIVVLSEFGGDRLLGKAREVADSNGYSVVALCSSRRNEEATRRLIYLGADEIVKIQDAQSIADWASALGSCVDEKTRLVIVAAGTFCDAILARAYALSKSKVRTFATGVDSIEESKMTKSLRSWGAVVEFPRSDKITFASLRLTSFPEPFEDSSRYGKVRESSIPLAEGEPLSGSYLDSSSVLTFLVGDTSIDQDLLSKIASRYNARIVMLDPKIEDIYGHCVAIGVRENSLPRFHGELISLDSVQGSAISKIADQTILTEDLKQALKELYA
ncbi:MAG: hypothetical protein ACYCQJ_00145 [Nitrososphaerales archaeon]